MNKQINTNTDKEQIEESFRNTLSNTKNQGIKYIWSGELRKKYVSQCLQWGVDNNILKLEHTDNAVTQESGYNIIWQ